MKLKKKSIWICHLDLKNAIGEEKVSGLRESLYDLKGGLIDLPKVI